MTAKMKRREFITLLGRGAAWPLAARAQTQRIWRIGMLMGYPMGDWEAQADIEAFRDALDALGWTRRNIWIDIRWGEPDDLESMQRFAKELVELQPDLIVSHTTPTTAALLQQTRTIPIVFTFVSDPVGSGFIASFLRPGGNITGFDMSEPIQAGKWVELLREVAPSVTRVAMLYNPASATYAEFWLNPFRATAAAFGMQAISAPVRTTLELDSVIAELVALGGAAAAWPLVGQAQQRERMLLAHRRTCVRNSGDFLTPSPPAEKATASQDQAGKASTGDGAGHAGEVKHCVILIIDNQGSIGDRERLGAQVGVPKGRRPANYLERHAPCS